MRFVCCMPHQKKLVEDAPTGNRGPSSWTEPSRAVLHSTGQPALLYRSGDEKNGGADGTRTRPIGQH